MHVCCMLLASSAVLDLCLPLLRPARPGPAPSAGIPGLFIRLSLHYSYTLDILVTRILRLFPFILYLLSANSLTLPNPAIKMTRFARGGNANKKKPHDASTWEQMTQQKKQSGKDDPSTRQGPTHSIQKRKPQSTSTLKRTGTGNSSMRADNKHVGQRSQSGYHQKVNGEMKNAVRKSRPMPSNSGKSIIDVLLEADKARDCDMKDERNKAVGDVKHRSVDTPELAAKKEQRSEERRINRQKKKADNMMCFHCRQPGHGVADCPQMLGDVEQGTGICYRCGSTEHDVSKCNAKVDKKLGDFPYAKCFICGQTGHLSRMCPDNPRGLYPEGGGCKECGSVEHKWWNCPVRKPVKGVDVSAASLAVTGVHTSADAEPAFMSKPKVKAKKTGPKVVVF